MDINQRDSAILNILGRNCRVPYTVLADVVRLSPNSVRYRVEALEEQGVIGDYALVIDLRPLGFTRHHVLLRLGCSADRIHEVCKKLATCPSSVWVASYVGAYDVQIIVDSHSTFSLNNILKELFALADSSSTGLCNFY